jgi:hypothetical protein
MNYIKYTSTKVHARIYYTMISMSLIVLLLSTNLYSCNPDVVPPEIQELNTWLNDNSAPPSTTDQDLIKRQKADVLVLPSITITVWAIGVLIAYIDTQLVYQSDASGMAYLIGQVFGQSSQWKDIDWAEETTSQAAHIQSSLDLVAYRSPSSDFYAITGNDYIRFLNQAYHSTILDPGELKKLLDGKIRPLGGYAKEYFEALRAASIQSRHFENASDGMCVRAEVKSLKGNVSYFGSAKANNHVNVISAAILASLKATTRCGMYNADIREFVYGFFNVSGQRGAIFDIFISHSLRTARLIYQYVDACQLPPILKVSLEQADCDDSNFIE